MQRPATLRLRSSILLLLAVLGRATAQLPAHQWSFGLASSGPELTKDLAMGIHGETYLIASIGSSPVDVDPGPGENFVSIPFTTLDQRAIVLAFDSAGGFMHVLWPDELHAIAATDVCVDFHGNLFVRGLFAGQNVDFDPGPGEYLMSAVNMVSFLAKFNAQGELLWAEQFDRPFPSEELGEMTADYQGNILMTTAWTNPDTADIDPGPGVTLSYPHGSKVIMKLGPDGELLWGIVLERQSPLGAGMEMERLLTLPNGDFAFVATVGQPVDFDPGAGQFILAPEPLTFAHAVVARYSASGQLLWAKNFGGDDGGTATDIATDFNGHFYVLGSTAEAYDLDPGPGTVPVPAAPADHANLIVMRLDGEGNYTSGFNIVRSGPSDWGPLCLGIKEGGVLICADQYAVPIDVDPSTSETLLSPPTFTSLCATYSAQDEFIGASLFEAAGMCRVLHMERFRDRMILAGSYQLELDADPTAALAPLAPAPLNADNIMLMSFRDLLTGIVDGPTATDGVNFLTNGRTITFTSAASALDRVSLADATGKEVRSERLNGHLATLDVHGLLPAMYVCSVWLNDGSRFTTRIVLHQ